tara:strand:+ start:65 stop:661 length:597 start_codon:yes stop_codon:yes gene_type:complete
MLGEDSHVLNLEWGIKQYLEGNLHIPSLFLQEKELLRASHTVLDTEEEHNNRLLYAASHQQYNNLSHKSIEWYLKRMIQQILLLQEAVDILNRPKDLDVVWYMHKQLFVYTSDYIEPFSTEGIYESVYCFLYHHEAISEMNKKTLKNRLFSNEEPEKRDELSNLDKVISAFESSEQNDLLSIFRMILTEKTSDDDIPF